MVGVAENQATAQRRDINISNDGGSDDEEDGDDCGRRLCNERSCDAIVPDNRRRAPSSPRD